MKRRTSRAKGILLLSFLVFAVVLGALVFRKYDTATRSVEPAPPATAPAGSAVVTLFFAAPDGTGLAREGRQVVLAEQVEEGVRSVVEELISGPVGSLAPTLPANTRVLGVQLAGDVARIDFGSEFRENLPFGSSAGMAAVYSIVDTVAVNFPAIKAVQFLIEGEQVEELGHLDLSTPLAPDFTQEQKEPEPAGK